MPIGKGGDRDNCHRPAGPSEDRPGIVPSAVCGYKRVPRFVPTLLQWLFHRDVTACGIVHHPLRSPRRGDRTDALDRPTRGTNASTLPGGENSPAPEQISLVTRGQI